MMLEVKKYPAIILAGGLGTRLRTAVTDKPKPMALVNNKPFLEYLLTTLEKSNVISSCILSVGYLHEQIEAYFGNKFGSLPLRYSIETSPLGTGGAVVKTLQGINADEFILVNGDTLFNINYSKLIQEHLSRKADVSIAIKTLKDFNRYGTVVCQNGLVKCFEEKKQVKEGYINGGVYMFNKNILLRSHLPDVFSLENDFLRTNTDVLKIAGIDFGDYFIDIGIPEDYQKAQVEFLKLFPD